MKTTVRCDYVSHDLAIFGREIEGGEEPLTLFIDKGMPGLDEDLTREFTVGHEYELMLTR